MAQSQKMIDSPLTVPSSITRLIEIFSITSEETAKSLIAKAITEIYFKEEKGVIPKRISDQDIDHVYALMKSMKPANTLESLYAAQIAMGHILGLQKLVLPYHEDQKLGLRLLRLSHSAVKNFKKS